MTNIEQNLRVMAYSLRKQARIEFDFDQQSRVAEMFRQLKESELINREVELMRYCWYGIESNALRQELSEGISEDVDLFSECLDDVFGSIEEVGINIRERHDELLEYSDVVLEEIEYASQIRFQMGIHIELLKALHTYRYRMAKLLVMIYESFTLDVEVEFVQYLQQLCNTPLN
jgi:hypothetical protein